MSEQLGVVILAAGEGTRMRSRYPKVLHRLAGKSLLGRVIESALQLDPARVVVVYGHAGEQVRQAIGNPALFWVEQVERLGTGHAVQLALPALAEMDRILVLYGDVPLVCERTLHALIAAQCDEDLALLTVELEDPHGYGRIVRDQHDHVAAIVEQKDANPIQLSIREVNTGILAASGRALARWLGEIDNNNAQREYYLTDIVALAVRDGVQVHAIQPESSCEVAGINDREQLAALERRYQQQQASALMRAGVTLRDPARFDLRGELQHGVDVEIDVNVILEGRVVLGDGVRIAANCVIRDSEIEAGAEILAHSLIEEAVVGRGARVGPFARLRPQTRLAERVHVGNFVEVKNSTIGPASKVNHLSYIGDSEIGARVNVGAGTITCNYDGANKHRTVIGDDAFIGSDSQLVAPVTVGSGATIGAGSTITRDVPEGELTLCRASEQRTVLGWQRPVKRRE